MKKHETGIGFERTDDREFICERWSVQPRIRFIDNVKWDPPVIDEILRKLQVSNLFRNGQHQNFLYSILHFLSYEIAVTFTLFFL